MRDKAHRRDITHQPPSNLTADGMDAWFLQQRQRERELRQRRKEAEELLRGYRATAVDTGYHPVYREGRYSLGTPSSAGMMMPSESLHDPEKMNLAEDDDFDKEGEGKYDDGDAPRSGRRPPATPSREEKKSDDFAALTRCHPSQEDRIITPQVTASRSTDAAAAGTAKELEQRPETIWRDFVSAEPGAKFPPEAKRYHLYVSYACPGSHRALIVRALKNLEGVVSVTYVHPTWRLTNPDDPHDKHRGWVFGDPGGRPFSNTIGRGGPFPPAYRGTDPDPLFGAYSIRELYEKADDNSGKYTIPLLWDKKLGTIVNNESSDIAYMLNSCFNSLSVNPELDLYTEADEDGRARLDEVSQWLAPLMIHGVYRCGFAKNQQAYDRAIEELCEAYDRADDILSRQRYLTGETLTDADIRLFVTLIRFDEVYSFYFKANARLVMLTPSLLNFCREVYQIPGIRDTCDMEQIKAHFYGSHAEWNKYSVIPRGLGFMDLLDMPHDRDELGSLCGPVIASSASTTSYGESTQTPMASSYNRGIGSFQDDESSHHSVTPQQTQKAVAATSPDDFLREQEF